MSYEGKEQQRLNQFGIPHALNLNCAVVRPDCLNYTSYQSQTSRATGGELDIASKTSLGHEEKLELTKVNESKRPENVGIKDGIGFSLSAALEGWNFTNSQE